MEHGKYKKYQAVRESTPAFTLNQIGKIAFNRAKAGEKYQNLNVITAQLMCALTMEAVLNQLGKKLFEDWEKTERKEKYQVKIKRIAAKIGLEVNLGSRPFQFLHEIFEFRDNLVHAKSSKHFANAVRENDIDENGFPIIHNIPELSTDWEKICNIDTAEKWRMAVDNISSILSEAAKLQNPIKVGEIVDTWGELEI